MKNKKGFTLVELVIVIALISIVSLMTASIFSFGIKSNERNQSLQESTESARLVLQILDKDIRSSSQKLELISEDTCFTLKDTLDESKTIKYCLKNEEVYRNNNFIIDKIIEFRIESIIDKGIEVYLVDNEGNTYDQKFYFRD